MYLILLYVQFLTVYNAMYPISLICINIFFVNNTIYRDHLPHLHKTVICILITKGVLCW